MGVRANDDFNGSCRWKEDQGYLAFILVADGRSPIGWRGLGGLWGNMVWDIDLLQTSSIDIYSLLSVWRISPFQVILAGMEIQDLLGRYCGGRY